MPYKIDLLRQAAKQGPSPFLDHLARSVRDSAWSMHHTVFVHDVRIDGPLRARMDTALRFAPAGREDLSDEDLARLAGVDWGSTEWFDRGWRLWTGRQGDPRTGQLAVTAWWRTGAQAPHFFLPIGPDGVLLWQCATLPEFRGRGFYGAALHTLVADRTRAGIRTFYINCRDYNFASLHAIERMGFRRAGISAENRFTRRRRWHPVPAAAPATAMEDPLPA